MSNCFFLLTIIVLFNYFILNVLAENSYYIISIRRNSKDVEYDKASEEVQNSIDKLVNDRMNDIYDIISKNRESYINENGKIDEKLNELDETLQLIKKRNVINSTIKKTQFKFINKNRISKQKINKKEKREEEFIPLESKLVIHICPVSNYYVIIAYLSDTVVPKIKALPNVISCLKSQTLKNHRSINHFSSSSSSSFSSSIKKENKKRALNTKIYNEEEILKETQWKGLGVQELEFNFELRNTHLSLISQANFNESAHLIYDNNYYYPASAGKGIDIYIIDDGLDISSSKANFDTYEGTPDERIIQCDGLFYDGQYHDVDKNNCNTDLEVKGYINHGTVVSIAAAGTLNGVAKKANIHMLAIDINSYDILTALDHVKQYAIPHKTVVNISSGCEGDHCPGGPVQDKVKELVDLGIIIFVSAGNSSSDGCHNKVFAGCEGVIPIGALNDVFFEESIEYIYRIGGYSSFGKCVQFFAPGAISVTDKTLDYIIFDDMGTSFSSPIVAGVAATIMSENLDINYDFTWIKNKLIELSIKDVIKGLDPNTPNRMINNGKRIIYGNPRCDDPSGEYHCQNQCCSKHGVCINPKSPDFFFKLLCDVDKGCNSEYGYCQKGY
ncbi:subtilisin-like protein [Anaeromyces robustus]|uniref:Subtilisin-like protein n=1 Tax=Anaeromyces robustus TaxID=1754192 RepID=A0A1Y1WQB8_9FUNG|nr:subtilisin-like protein [Anaeromyces robustus]|eukprot:ORX75595.1 subtilisin-like protein [Anaeromyces robustus]